MDSVALSNVTEAILNKTESLILERSDLQRELSRTKARLRYVEDQLRDCKCAARVFEIDLDIPISEAAPISKNALTLKEFAIEHLKSVAERGEKVGPIRNAFIQISGRRIHDKTVGMTLYRLSREGLVYRRGRVWYSNIPSELANSPTCEKVM